MLNCVRKGSTVVLELSIFIPTSLIILTPLRLCRYDLNFLEERISHTRRANLTFQSNKPRTRIGIRKRTAAAHYSSLVAVQRAVFLLIMLMLFFNRLPPSPGELYLILSRAIKWNGATAWSNLVVRLISHRRRSVRNACISLAPSFFPLRPTGRPFPRSWIVLTPFARFYSATMLLDGRDHHLPSFSIPSKIILPNKPDKFPFK